MSFSSGLATKLAIRFPQHASRAIDFLRNSDPESAIEGIGKIGETIESAGPAVLEFLKLHKGPDSSYWIGRIGYVHDELSKPALEILKERREHVALHFMTDIGSKSIELALAALEILKTCEEDEITEIIGELGHAHEESVARAAFDILKPRPGELAANELTSLVREDYSLAPEILAELQSRTELDSSRNISYIGREVDDLALPVLKILKGYNSSYADAEIEKLGLTIKSVRAEAIRALIERKSYARARSLTGIDHVIAPAFNLRTVLIARDDALAAGTVDPAVIDREYTTPLIGKIISGKDSFYGKKGELAEILKRAATIVSAENQANDNGSVHSVAEPAP